MADGDHYLTYAEARKLANTTDTTIDDDMIEIMLDAIQDRIHLRIGVTTKQTNTQIVNILKGIQYNTFNKMVQNVRTMSENNPT